MIHPPTHHLPKCKGSTITNFINLDHHHQHHDNHDNHHHQHYWLFFYAKIIRRWRQGNKGRLQRWASHGFLKENTAGGASNRSNYESLVVQVTNIYTWFQNNFSWHSLHFCNFYSMKNQDQNEKEWVSIRPIGQVNIIGLIPLCG